MNLAFKAVVWAACPSFSRLELPFTLSGSFQPSAGLLDFVSGFIPTTLSGGGLKPALLLIP